MIRYRRVMSLVLSQPLDRASTATVRTALDMRTVGRFDDDEDQILGRRTESLGAGHLRLHLSRRATEGPWSIEVLADPVPSPSTEQAIEHRIRKALEGAGVSVDHVFRPPRGP